MTQTIAERLLIALLAKGDQNLLQRGGSNPEETLATVTAKRWRRSALSEYSASDVRQKIERAWEEEAALTFTVPCGGYKSWRVPGSPFPNWAEVFFISYIRRYVREINSVYPHGVRVELTYVSGVMDLVSNHVPEWQQEYVAAMRVLLSHYADEPDQLALVDIASLPESGDVREAVVANYRQRQDEWDGPLSDSQLAKLKSAERNFCPNGAQRIDDADLADRILNSAIFCDALDSLDARRNYNKFDSRIQLVFDRRPQPAVHIGTCETSTTHFWVSVGVLEQRGERFLPRMIGHTSLPSQHRETIRVFDVAERRAAVGEWLPEVCEVI